MSATTIPAPKTQHRTIGGRAFAGCLLLGTMLACGPVTSHSVRWSRAPADAS